MSLLTPEPPTGRDRCTWCENHIRRELSLLFKVSNAVMREDDISSVLRHLMHILSETTEIVRATVTIFNRKTGKISIQEAFGISDEERARGVYEPGEGITGQVIESGVPRVVRDISREPSFLNRTGTSRDLDSEHLSFISVPIKAGKEVIGTLNAHRPYAAESLLDEDVYLLQIVAAMISQAAQLFQAHHEENQHLLEENERLHRELESRFDGSHVVGNSKVIRRVFEYVRKIANSNATVLILGESGVGKELVAKAIHYSSSRKNGPFVKLNCAALPESIVESELFGHERGAFTGAVRDRQGRFELAQGGTIFLDEIGELSPNIQTKLLRVLQEREFERVGGTRTIRVDVRIITATNRDLEAEMKSGVFREDLYYRLNIIPITVPPLRERKSDIPLLANHFVEKFSEQNGKQIERISTPAIDMLFSYHWPGNVRELENCIEHAVILSEDNVIHGYHLPPTLQMAVPDPSGSEERGSLQQQLDALEYELLVEALKAAKGNLSAAARELGLTNRMIGIRAKKYGLDYRKFRSYSPR